MINIIDVTLRDGGHAVKFDWPLEFAREYYEVVSAIPDVKLVELGYWGQTSKSSNMFYNLDFEKVCDVTNGVGRKNVSIMVDYHYCSHNLSDYPNSEQDEISMIRLCSRKRDLDEALGFISRLKEYTRLQTSLNVFNVTNYSHKELKTICKQLAKSGLDYVYFADTHGALDIRERAEDFREYVNILNACAVKAGMHLHDHGGRAYYNFSTLQDIGFVSTDASTSGMGKGEGNLRLEHIISKSSLPSLLQIIDNNKEILSVERNPYCLVTAKYSITDYYALKARQMGISLVMFDSFCQGLSGQDKDVYNETSLSMLGEMR